MSGLVKKGIFAFTLLSLAALFQNCAKATFRGINSDSHSLSFNLDNNGTGYGGKLIGQFYRFHPDFTCEGKEAPVSSILAKDSGITLTENKKLFCGAVQRPLDASAIDRSVFQNDIIGFLEGIFESETAPPASIPANLVEVWCKDRNDDSGIETLTHFNRSTSEAVTRIYYSNLGLKKQITDFSVSRVAANQLVTVKDGKGFLLKVYRDKPATQLGLFQGSMEAVIEGQKVTRETSCRLGGTLDAQLWPAKQIVDSNITTLKVSPDGLKLAYTSLTGSTLNQLFSAQIDGQKQQLVSPPMLSKGVNSFDFAPNSNSLLYWGDPRIAWVLELFKINLDGTGLTQINPLLKSSGQSLQMKLLFSADGSRVIFQDGHQSTWADNEMSLSSSLLSGSGMADLSPPSNGPDVSVYAFEVSKQTNKVVFNFADVRGISSHIYSVNLDGTSRTALPVNPPAHAGGWEILWYEDLVVPDPGNWVFIRSFSQGDSATPFAYLTTADSIDGSKSWNFPLNWRWFSSDPTGSTALLWNYDAKSPQFQLMDLSSGQLMPLPSGVSPLTFTRDGSSLIALQTNSNGVNSLVSVLLKDGSITALCPQASSATLQVKEILPGTLLVASWDSSTQILNFYLQSSGLACTKQNSIPVAQPVLNLKDSILSPDQTKLAVPLSVTVEGKTQSQLYYVPLDGAPALQVDSPVFVGATLSNVHFLEDSKTVFYSGEQIRSGDAGAFLWKAP